LRKGKSDTLNKTWKIVRTVLIFAVLAAGIVAYFLYLSNKSKGGAEEPTAVQTDSEGNEKNPKVTALTSRDLTLNYPGTPRAVLTYYSDLLVVLYKEEYGTDEFKEICDHIRGLFDDELLEKNPYDDYYDKLWKEVQAYKSVNRFVSAYVLEDSYNEKHQTLLDREYAMIDIKYIVMENGSMAPRTYEKFTLRKDENGKWKILFWVNSSPEEMEE